MRYELRSLPAILTLALCLLTGCSNGQKEPASGEPDAQEHREHAITLTTESTKAMGLRTTVVEEKPLSGHMVLPATLIPNQDLEAQVGSLVQGRVREVFVTVGAVVKEHQELMRIEGLEVGEIKSGFIKARAQLTYAEAAFERQKTLLAEKVGSQGRRLPEPFAIQGRKALGVANQITMRKSAVGHAGGYLFSLS